jgi:hypothetical protein
VTRTGSLFKFRPFNKSSIELLVNRELWFARPDSLNDPFECQFNPDTIFAAVDAFPMISKEEITRTKKIALDTFNSMGICSFSRARKNQLMWTHYADEHKGFCIGFNETKLTINEPKMKSIDVVYQSDLPSKSVVKKFEKITDHKLEGKFDKEAFYSIIGTKYTYWKYERESRLVLVQSKSFPFSADSVVSIAFGLRMSDRDKETLKKLLSSPEWKHLKWYQAEKTKGKFALDFPAVKI